MSKKKLEVKHISQLEKDDSYVACAKMVIDYMRERNGKAPLAEYSAFLREAKERGLFCDTCAGATNLINQYTESGSYISIDLKNSTVTNEDVKIFLDAEYPAIVIVESESGSSHAVVIFEYSDDNSKKKADCFKILDPLCTKEEMESDEKVPYLGSLKISYEEFNSKLAAKTFSISGMSRHN